MKWIDSKNVVKDHTFWFLKIVDVEENKENKYHLKTFKVKSILTILLLGSTSCPMETPTPWMLITVL